MNRRTWVSEMDWSNDPESWMQMTADDLVGFEGAIKEAARADRHRVERALRGAIRAGYDGVDINRPDPIDGVGIVSIIPWDRPEPDGANGYRTDRYTWDWFSDDELTAILSADNPMAVLQKHD